MTIDARVMATTGQLSEFPYNEDTSGGDQSLLGIGFVQSSIGRGVRSSSSTSYLANANSRPNLTVLINVTVMKLLQSGTKGALKSFRSVQFSSSPGMQPLFLRTLNNTFPRWFCANDCEGSQRSNSVCRDDWDNANTSIIRHWKCRGPQSAEYSCPHRQPSSWSQLDRPRPLAQYLQCEGR